MAGILIFAVLCLVTGGVMLALPPGWERTWGFVALFFALLTFALGFVFNCIDFVVRHYLKLFIDTINESKKDH